MVEAASCPTLITVMCFSAMLQFSHSASGFSVHHSTLRLMAGVIDTTHCCTLHANAARLHPAVSQDNIHKVVIIPDSRKFYIINATGDSSLCKSRASTPASNTWELRFHINREHFILHSEMDHMFKIKYHILCSIQ